VTRFGYFLSCEEYTPEQLLEQARLAEQAGFDDVYVANMGPHYADMLAA
jgi:hypothetical protein